MIRSKGELTLGGLIIGCSFCLQVDGLITRGGRLLAEDLISEGAYKRGLIIRAKGGLHPVGL